MESLWKIYPGVAASAIRRRTDNGYSDKGETLRSGSVRVDTHNRVYEKRYRPIRPLDDQRDRQGTKFNPERELYIYCPELLPFLGGEVDAGLQPHGFKITNMLVDTTNDIAVNLAETITAEYLGLPTNTDVPDVHIGEQVMIYNYAGTDKYYWIPIRDQRLRRFEHYRISVADRDETDKELNRDNTLIFEFDTKYSSEVGNQFGHLEIGDEYTGLHHAKGAHRHKHFMILTPNSNGEPFRYMFKFDMVSGEMILKDDAHNEIYINSSIPRIQLINGSGTEINLDNEDLRINVPRDLVVKVGRNEYREVGDTRRTTVGHGPLTPNSQSHPTYPDLDDVQEQNGNTVYYRAAHAWNSYTPELKDDIRVVHHDSDCLIMNDKRVHVMNDQTELVDNNKTETVMKNKTVTVDVALATTVNGGETRTIAGNRSTIVDSVDQLEAKATAVVKAPSITLDGDVGITKSLNVSQSISFGDSISGPNGSWHNP